jgi:hypothetical protein
VAFGPNFTGVSRRDDVVVVAGKSADPAEDVLDITVSLRQGDRMETASVGRVGGASWEVGIPAAGFAAAPAVLLGVEMRRENATTVTWTQTFDIPAS